MFPCPVFVLILWLNLNMHDDLSPHCGRLVLTTSAVFELPACLARVRCCTAW